MSRLCDGKVGEERVKRERQKHRKSTANEIEKERG